MPRSLNALTLTLVALCALAALAASSASAFFDAKAEHVNLTGTQTSNHVLTTSLGTIACKKATFSGTAVGKSTGDGYWTTEDVTVHPQYAECTAFGFTATMDTTFCDYTFTRTSKDADGTPKGPIHITCSGTNKIRMVIAGFCTMEIPPQTPVGHVAYHTKNAGTANEDVEVTSTVTGIKYEGNCGSGANGTYSGKATVQATDTAGALVQSKVT